MKFFRKDWILYDEIAKDGGQRPDTLIELQIRTEDPHQMGHIPKIEKNDLGYTIKHENNDGILHPMNIKHHLVTVVLQIDEQWIYRYDFNYKKDTNPNVKFNVDHGTKVKVFSFCNLHGLYYSSLE
ncbi:desulfoferrodoxin family protein [Mycoplasmoides alvi]|uniref:desulfoferrodoxin family protein n=1 Tax=Mycoplasmoides alvi TaxID=78580 RepID=UPI00051BED59|nr:desulfoferrodoxin family protein [Mycoplasmoides alvi]